MKIIQDCWEEISASEGYFGAHLFEDSTAKIYMESGLDVSSAIDHFFSVKDEHGFVGHCVLVFRECKVFNYAVTPREVQNGVTVWKTPIVVDYHGGGTCFGEGGLKEYLLGGGLCGFDAYVSVRIEAASFELHILDQNELK
jgi:hypothetical protein